MIRWLKLLTLPDWLVGHAPLLGQGSPATLVLPGLTIVAIVEMALERWPEAGQLVIVDPQASDELARTAAEKGSRLYKRFVYYRKERGVLLVESDHIAEELKDDEFIQIDVY